MAFSFLITGLALDHRAFDGLNLPPGRFRWIDFIPAEPQETLPNYALRMAGAMGFRPGDAVGGFSLGGMLALEIARQCQASRILLLSSCTHPGFLHPSFHFFGRLARWTPQSVLQFLFSYLPTAMRLIGMHDAKNAAFLREIMGSFPPALLRQLPAMVLDWRGCEPAAPCFALHSEHDWLIRPPLHLAELTLLPGNSHLTALPQPEATRNFLLAHGD